MSDKDEALHVEKAQDATAPPTAAREKSDTAAPSSAVLPPSQHDYVREGFQNRTKGEKWFNIGTYVGVGYFGSLAATVLLTWFLRDSKRGWPVYQKFNDWIANSTKGSRAGQALEDYRETVDSNMTILSMFTGTTLMAIFPIKWIEDSKARIVKSLDKKFYGEEAVANDPKLIAAHEQLDASPKQTWSSIGLSRVLAFGATLVTSLAIGSHTSPLAKSTGHSIDRLSIRSGRWIDRKMNKGKPEVGSYIDSVTAHSPNKIARADQPPDRMMSRLYNYLVLDGLYTVMTTSLLFIFTRVFAPVFDKSIKQRKRDERTAYQGSMAPAPQVALPRPANDVAPQPANDTGTKPDAKVSDVVAGTRLAADLAEHAQGA